MDFHSAFKVLTNGKGCFQQRPLHIFMTLEADPEKESQMCWNAVSLFLSRAPLLSLWRCRAADEL